MEQEQPPNGPETGFFELAGYREALAERLRVRQSNVIEFPAPLVATPDITRHDFGTFKVSFGGFVSKHESQSLPPSDAPKLVIRVPPRPTFPQHLVDAGFEPVLGLGESGTLHWLMRRVAKDELLVVGLERADLFDDAEFHAALPKIEDECRWTYQNMFEAHPEHNPFSIGCDRLGIQRQLYRWQVERQRVVPWFVGRQSLGIRSYSVRELDADELAWQILYIFLVPPVPTAMRGV